jgi:hypothetical protein
MNKNFIIYPGFACTGQYRKEGKNDYKKFQVVTEEIPDLSITIN